jgi:tripartite-type tricarboxylate transporter receptor subunit TctC
MAHPLARERLGNLGAEITVSTPAEFGKFLADELALWSSVVKAANIKVQ